MLFSLIYFFAPFSIFYIPYNYVIPQAMLHAIPQTHSAFYPHRIATSILELLPLQANVFVFIFWGIFPPVTSKKFCLVTFHLQGVAGASFQRDQVWLTKILFYILLRVAPSSQISHYNYVLHSFSLVVNSMVSGLLLLTRWFNSQGTYREQTFYLTLSIYCNCYI